MADRDGTLRARAPIDQVRLERLVEGALPASGAAAVSGSILLRRSPVLPPFVIHVKPVGVAQPDYGARHVAALVLIVEPGRQRRVEVYRNPARDGYQSVTQHPAGDRIAPLARPDAQILVDDLLP